MGINFRYTNKMHDFMELAAIFTCPLFIAWYMYKYWYVKLTLSSTDTYTRFIVEVSKWERERKNENWIKKVKEHHK